jgi:hypothetical protein
MSDQHLQSPYEDFPIEVGGGVEHIRRRPGMYIGDVGESGLHYLVLEAVMEVTSFANWGGRRGADASPFNVVISHCLETV